jgi:hypothetical protein
MMMFLTGSLAGVLASNGLKHQKDNNDNSKTSTEN